MLSNNEAVCSIFQDIGMNLANSITVFVIGGAAMQYYNLKDATKDIDIICITQEDRKALIKSACSSGFVMANPEIRHQRLNGIGRIAIKGPHTVDIFAETITGTYRLTSGMRGRALSTNQFGKLCIKYTSVEDIFIMKLIAARENDIEDCAKIMMHGLDFNVVFEEIELQFHTSEKNNYSVWITYIDESIGRLEEEYGVSVPIADKISALSNEWMETHFNASE